ncbi:MAG: hypothetical protein Q4C79_09325, partial [Neisseria sp.]|uniref:hypothetical protein n=1 Tax=Neisseria sp. TaxID=192066 RepID=UPI0026DCFF0C
MKKLPDIGQLFILEALRGLLTIGQRSGLLRQKAQQGLDTLRAFLTPQTGIFDLELSNQAQRFSK